MGDHVGDATEFRELVEANRVRAETEIHRDDRSHHKDGKNKAPTPRDLVWALYQAEESEDFGAKPGGQEMQGAEGSLKLAMQA
jgi:hypothetical protein